MRPRVHAMVSVRIGPTGGTALLVGVLAGLLFTTLPVRAGLAQTAPGKLAGTWRGHQCSDCVGSMAVTTDRVWIGTLSGGVVRIDRASGTARRFTLAEGLGGSCVLQLAVGPDGDVWVATLRTVLTSAPSGVSHWDGRAWTVYGTRDGLPDAMISGLAAGPGGTVLAIVPGGIARFHGARWHLENTADGLPSATVAGVSIAADGTPWAATDAGLARHDGARWQAVATDGLGGDQFAAVAADDDGTVWALAGTATGPAGSILGHFRPGGWPTGAHWQAFAVPGKGDAVSLGGPSGDRVVTVVDHDYRSGAEAIMRPMTRPLVHRLASGTWSTVDVLGETAPQRPTQITADPAGAIWMGTIRDGIAVRDAETWTWLRTDLGIPSVLGMSVGVDRSDRPWAGAVPYLYSGDASAYLAHYNGERWVRHGAGDIPGLKPGPLGIWQNGIDGDSLGNVWITVYGAGVARYDGAKWATWTITDVVGSASDHWTIAADGRGGAWIAGLGAAHLVGGAWRPYRTADGLADDRVNALAVDPRSGRDVVWFATDGGISRLDGATWRTFAAADGVPADAICSAVVSIRDGAAWFGTRGSATPNSAQVARFDGTRWRTYGASDGIVGTQVWALAEAPDGAIWAATGAETGGSGVLRFDGSRWAVYTSADGLADDLAFDVEVASDGTVWVATLAGMSEFRPDGPALVPTPTPETPRTPTPFLATPTVNPTRAPERHTIYLPFACRPEAR